MTMVAALFALIGFAGLALGMERHQGVLLTSPLWSRRRRGAAIVGWSAIALAYAAVTWTWGLAVGAVLWVGLLSLGAIIVLLTISRRAHR